jgi:signal transduction histidine kinase
MDDDVVLGAARVDRVPPDGSEADPSPRCTVDSDGQVLFANRAFRRIAGCGAGADLAAMLVDPPRFDDLIRRIATRDGATGVDLALRCPDGSRRWMRTFWTRWRTAGSEVWDLRVFDITSWKHAETERDAARTSLVRAEAMASLGELAAGVTHDVGTPLGIGVTAASHLADQVARLREGFESGRLRKAEMSDFLAAAVEGTRLLVANLLRADELIQSFKTLAADRASGARRTFELKSYLEEVLFSLQPRLKRSSVAIELDCPADVRLDSFPGALSQVVTNLVLNAVVHAFAGRPGTVRIAAETCGERVVLVVADDGAGIPPADLERVFQPFFTTRGAEGGTGLGLHIVRTAVTGLLGGSVEVASAPGEGTRFTIALPLIAPEAAPIDDGATPV